MKTKKSLALAMLSTFTAMIILTPSAYAASSTPLNLSMQGEIVNAGTQAYFINGGSIVAGTLFGNPVPSGAHLSFNFFATVVGLKTSGSGSLTITNSSDGKHDGWGNGGGWGNEGSNTILSANIRISDEIPASVFPLNPDFSSCDPSTQACTSEVPLLFTGIATLNQGGQSGQALPIGVESAYWNPLGGSILITSLDPQTSIFLIVTYNTATIMWSKTQLQGALGGMYGTEQVSGGYALTSYSFENLAAGSEHDAGQISFVGMSDSSLNMAGLYTGTTTFSLAGSYDCSAPFGLPPGTCTATGATSTGNFNMANFHGMRIAGSFNTVWSVPSIIATTTVTATVTQH